MSTYPLPAPTPTDLWTLTGPVADYAVLGGVEIKVVKNFATTTSPLVTINAPVGETITGILSCVCNIWPQSIHVVDIAGTYYIEFDTTISFFAQCASGGTCLLQQTLTAQGVLGAVGTVIPSSPLSFTTPTLTAVGTGFTATTVFGQIQIGPFTVDVCELKSVKVAVDPTAPINPPLI